MAGEKQFESKVKRFLQEFPQVWYTKIWGGGYQKAGIPDMLCCINGVFVAIELKASRGTPSELQKWNVRNINNASGLAIILYPEGFENFKKIVEGVIHCNSHIHALNHLRTAHSSTSCIILTK